MVQRYLFWQKYYNLFWLASQTKHDVYRETAGLIYLVKIYPTKDYKKKHNNIE